MIYLFKFTKRFTLESLASLLTVFAFLIFIYIWLTPSTYWYEYHSVEPAKPVFSSNEEIRFISTRSVYRKGSFYWNDILRCNFDTIDTDFLFYFSYNTSAKNSKITDNTSSEWVYLVVPPDKPASCYLESNITMKVALGFEKDQQIISSVFRVE